MYILYHALLSLIQYIVHTPSNPKWLRCAWNSNFISKYAHIYMECVLCIVVSLTTLDPISLGTKMYLNVILGTLEMHWKLVSSTRKVLSPCAYWSQARMIVNSYLLHHQCYLGNKCLPHAYISSFQPCVGYILAWISFVRYLLSFSEHPIFHLIPCGYFFVDAMMSMCWKFIYIPLR